MKATLSFGFECGGKRCAPDGLEEIGVSAREMMNRGCRFLIRWRCGTECRCHFFGALDVGEDGWPERHPDCLAQAKVGEEEKGRRDGSDGSDGSDE